MNNEINHEMESIGKNLSIAACAMHAAVVSAAKVLKNGVSRLAKNVESMIVNMAATPNERRMMHNKRLRIRKKYYNRVKRRITK